MMRDYVVIEFKERIISEDLKEVTESSMGFSFYYSSYVETFHIFGSRGFWWFT